MLRRTLIALTAAWSLPLGALSAQVVINEFVSSNIDGLVDEDRERPDWIELRNLGSNDVDLEGWGLSDDGADPHQWAFPKMVLPAGERLVVFASGKDRSVFVNTYQPLVSVGDVWSYWEGVAEPPPNWKDLGFSEAGWSSGPSGFGYGDGDDNTIVSAPTVYLRLNFQLTQAQIDAMSMLYLHVDHDDAFVAYLNGVEIGRDNIGEVGVPPAFDDTADESREARLFRSIKLDAHVIGDFDSLLQPGNNVLAIQGHNQRNVQDDLSVIPILTSGTATTTPGGGHPLLRFPEHELHANFRLSALGDEIWLHDAAGALQDQVDTGRMYADRARGRRPDGAPTLYYLRNPTPNLPNSTDAVTEFSGPVSASPVGGITPGAQTVTLTTGAAGAAIYYTLDGSDPTNLSTPYTGPLQLGSQITVLRARALEPGKGPGPITTNTYIQSAILPPMPIVSVVSDPVNLWDPDRGIYAMGPGASSTYPHYGANFWKDWERPVHLEFFDELGVQQFRHNAGMKIHGGASRGNAQKTLRLLARSGYETDSFEYPFFPKSSLDRFRRMILRNAGNDWCVSQMRDAIAHELTRGIDLEVMEYVPTLVLLNGEFWGIHNLRERQDKYYVEERKGADPDNVDLLERNSVVIEGDAVHYKGLTDFVKENPLSIESNYQWVTTQMDVDNFADYNVVQIFIANNDWPGNNMKFWRPRTPDGRWRWLMYDCDFAFALTETVEHNTLEHTLATSGSAWNPSWATLLLRKLVENEGFLHRFLNRYADYLNTRFLPANSIATATEVADGIRPVIDFHQIRWNANPGRWDANYDEIVDFLTRRPAIARQHLRQRFQIPGDYTLSLDVDPPGAGRLQLTAITVDGPWSGEYFLGIPVAITAIPNGGYQFDSWSDPLLGTSASATIDPPGNYGVTARFVQSDEQVVITEINYNSAPTFDPGDWLELYNNTDTAVDLTGWAFEDEGNRFDFPSGTVLPARSHLVLCEDLGTFQSLFPGVTNVIGDLGFGFRGSGERLRVLEPQSVLHDEVHYDDEPPWPTEPDGNGPTLELIDPNLDNADPASWRASQGNGTPGT